VSHLKKSWRLIPREMSIKYSAFESALERFVRLNKEEDFIGKQGRIDTGFHETGTELEIEMLGELFKTTVIEESPYDPQNEKLRA
jgi:glycine cleavage system aminomethyltransferase T